MKQEVDTKGAAVFSVGEYSYVITSKFLQDKAGHTALDDPVLDIACPVRFLHGMNDESVPFSVAMETAERISSRDVHVLMRKTSDHRFSQADDIEIMFETLDYLAFGVKELRDLALKTWSASSLSHQPQHMIDNPRIHQLNRD